MTTELETAQRNGDFEKASRIRFSTIPSLQAKLPRIQAELSAEQHEGQEKQLPNMVVRDRVTSEDIAVV